MTEKQIRFIKEYMIDLNAKQAAIRAGYSAKTAKEQGYRLLKNPKIRTRVDEELALRSQHITERNDRVARELERIAFADVNDFIDLTTGELKASPADMPAHVSVKVKKTKTKDAEILQFEIKLHDKLKALKKLNRYFKKFSQISETKECPQDIKVETPECPQDIEVEAAVCPQDIKVITANRPSQTDIPSISSAKSMLIPSETDLLQPLLSKRGGTTMAASLPEALEGLPPLSKVILLDTPAESNIIDISSYTEHKKLRSPLYLRMQKTPDKSEQPRIKNPEEQPFFRWHGYPKPA